MLTVKVHTKGNTETERGNERADLVARAALAQTQTASRKPQALNQVKTINVSSLRELQRSALKKEI